MHVRSVRSEEEEWLQDTLDAFGMEDPAFEPTDYVVAEAEDDGKVGFGRLRIHAEDRPSENHPVCELTNVGVLEDYRGEGVGALIVATLVEEAEDDGFEAVYSVTPEPNYLTKFGFDPANEEVLPEVIRERRKEKQTARDVDVTPVLVDVDQFTVPLRLRREPEEAEEAETNAEDFGIDTEGATYKYDTGK